MGTAYFADLSYIDYFYKGLSPWYLSLAAALGGSPGATLAPGFTYCELGCGTGLSLVLHAAANPQGRFYGVDLNHEHIQRAQATAQAGNLGNVTFLEEDFRNLLEVDLPHFDRVVLHGVLSWISPAMRKEVLGFLGSRLKPGGLLYLSYNTLPGWAHQAPLRHFMHTHVDGQGGETLAKVQKGLEYLRMLLEIEAPVLAASPQMKAQAEHILASDPRYVAHEYFTADWEPFYFQQVAEDVGRFGLRFAGCLPLGRNYAEFCLPQAALHYVSTLPSREAFETHKDFIMNTIFRRDVFRMGPAPASAPPSLDGVVVGSPLPREAFQAQMPVGDGQSVALNEGLFGPMADLLARNRLPVAELMAHPTLAAFPAPQVLTALTCFLASDQAMPYSPFASEPRRGLSPLNLHLLERDLPTAGTLYLACEEAGTALAMSRSDALLVLGVHEAGREGAAAWAKAWWLEHGLEPEADPEAALERLPLGLLGLG